MIVAIRIYLTVLLLLAAWRFLVESTMVLIGTRNVFRALGVILAMVLELAGIVFVWVI